MINKKLTAKKEVSDKLKQNSYNVAYGREIIDNMHKPIHSSSKHAKTLTVINNDFATEIMQVISKAVNTAIQQNNKLGQEFLSCKDSKDLLQLQHKFITTNFIEVSKCYFDIFMIFEEYILKNFEASIKNSRIVK